MFVWVGIGDDDGLPGGEARRTVMGAEDACGDVWTAWAGVAVIRSASVGVMLAFPWTLRTRWWRSAGSVQVSVVSMIQWRRMAWSPGVISYT